MNEINNVKKVYISEEANPELKEYLKKNGYKLAEIIKTDAVYDEVSAHPDIYMCKLGAEENAPVYHGDINKLGFKYPENIRYNAAVCGRFFLHNLRYTDSDLLAAARLYISEKYADSDFDTGESSEYTEIMKEIYVPQGYTKCNIVVVSDDRIITSDAGIERYVKKALKENGLKENKLRVLLVEPGQVELKGFNYGFLGGASGRVGDEIVFNGDITVHSDYGKIKEFIEEAGLGIKYFDYPLTDIGSIIAEE